MERRVEAMKLSVRMEVHWEEVLCRLSADVVRKGRPRLTDLTGRDRGCEALGG